ncbi:probable cationic amino acid transporter [Erinaceus europaeus]|uniref:Probable cationic amino acid transporter n=1 Tax=Erinaceus europaeus TaxID=9365 RepID=A0A1S2ZF40_ERIEU|nr:probable cationic amino acid transporter [Erinaceus europaeus]XP_060027935.1 probable cationic amino acid transporter [Erinaceus europaeus]
MAFTGGLPAAWAALLSRLLRTQPPAAMQEGARGPRLAQVLSAADLVSLGVGSCAGTGMYVVAGLVAKEMAGPGVIVSFIIAAVASILSGVCYAEFGVRVPKTTGSAYTYSYVAVGELVAFFIGWNLILEYLIGTAAGASALSSMFDSLANHSISRWTVHTLGTLNGLGKGEESYPDLLALLIAVGVTLVVALGAKNSVGLNNVLNVLNLAVWAFIMVAGLFFLNGKYWADGQFLPHGWSGVLQGAATCFYAFIGFDIIATTGEEAKNPNTSIPYAITASLVICLTAYVSVSVILTLMVPCEAIDTEAPLMEMFVAHGFYAAKFVVAVGAVAGLTVSLLGSLFPMPRVIYAMAGDGLLFRFLAHVNTHTETPVVACVVSGFLAALLALLVSLRDLIEMMSIGTLLAYTLVSLCVLLLRYQPAGRGPAGGPGDLDTPEGGSPASSQAEPFPGGQANTCGAPNLPSVGDSELLIGPQGRAGSYGAVDGQAGGGPTGGRLPRLRALLGPHYYTLRLGLGLPGRTERPTPASGRRAAVCALLLPPLAAALCGLLAFGSEPLGRRRWWAVLLATLLAALLACLVLALLRQPQNPERLPYMAPGLPFVPAGAVLVNVYLMLRLSALTWIRFAVWCFLGMLIYFGYGIWNSSLELSAREEALHQSTYQRYDVDDPFSLEEGFSYATEGESQDWTGPAEDKGFSYQQMSEARPSPRTGIKAKSKSKHKQNSEALVANEELEFSPE